MPPTDPVPPPPPAAAGPPRRKGVSMPAWVATILILLVTAGLGYGAWSIVRPTPRVDLNQYEAVVINSNNGVNAVAASRPNRPGNILRRLATATQAVDNVVINPNGTGAASVANLQVQFNDNPGRRVRDITPRVNSMAENAAVYGHGFALTDAARRAAANVTDAQLEQLKQFPVPTVGFTAEQQATMLQQFDAFKAASPEARPAAEKALLDTMRAIGDGRRQTAIDVRADATRVHKILTPQQITILQQRPPATTMRKP